MVERPASVVRPWTRWLSGQKKEIGQFSTVKPLPPQLVDYPNILLRSQEEDDQRQDKILIGGNLLGGNLVYMSLCWSVRPSIRPSIHLSVRPSVHPYVRPSVRPSVPPFIHLSIRPFVRLFIFRGGFQAK